MLALAEHGSFVTDDLVGTPLLVVRDGERVRVDELTEESGGVFVLTAPTLHSTTPAAAPTAGAVQVAPGAN